MRTPACEAGDHDRCRCLLPGQDRRWAGLVGVATSEGLIPTGRCACGCHDADWRDVDAALGLVAAP